MKPIRVVIAEDHPVFRSALETLLADHDGLDVVGTVGTGRERVEMVRNQSPDLSVVDLRMPVGDGIWPTSEISSTSTRVLVLTSAEDERAISEALGAGASGYVVKSAEPDAIVEAVLAVAARIVPLSDTVLAAMGVVVSAGATGSLSSPPGSSRSSKLSPADTTMQRSPDDSAYWTRPSETMYPTSWPSWPSPTAPPP